MARKTTTTKKRIPKKRWAAIIGYVDYSCDKVSFDEFTELGEIIEKGPDWNLIESINISLNRDGRDAIGKSLW